MRDQRDVVVLDVLEKWMREGPPTRETFQDFFWPIDGHHNPRGYELLGQSISEAIIESDVVLPK